MPLNLFGIAGRMTGAVNPCIPADLYASDGVEDTPSGEVVPKYIECRIWIEVQAMTSQDLQQVENLNQQGDMRAVYIRGGIKTLNRPLQYGGDFIKFYDSFWKVTQSLEEWGEAEWCKVAVTRQISPPPGCS
ncbi:hypothetical protein [Acetobacter sp. P1H12_c]|uniref:hypothetical protein n=1 Tax=Acetobacter sp. P1H12_c TaxID=2762621 RepID=UPI001C046110|nr:hypothetical protein [Acetobacter sp. P1H12_c]